MPSPQECRQLKEDLADLYSLGEEFDRLLKTAVQSGKEEDIQRLEELKLKMTSKKERFKEKLWPFPELPRTELEFQYNSQIEVLERTGLLVRLSNQGLGIRINNPSNPSGPAQEYPLPSFQEITRRLRPSFAEASEGKEKREILKNKISQGFNQLQITPLVSIRTLQQTLGRILIEHHNNHKLFKTKRNPTDPDESLDLDIGNPVFVYDQFQDNDRLRYYPQAFNPDNHQGITKDQLIAETLGFNIILTEKNQFLPQENDPNNLPIHNRKRIENNKTPIEYLNLQNPASVQDFGVAKQYQGESYLIIEDWLTQFIIHLEQTNQVLNDWHDNNAAWLPGNYLPPTLQERQQNPNASGRLPNGRWDRDDRKAKVDWDVPGIRFPRWGVLPAVRVS